MSGTPSPYQAPRYEQYAGLLKRIVSDWPLKVNLRREAASAARSCSRAERFSHGATASPRCRDTGERRRIGQIPRGSRYSPACVRSGLSPAAMPAPSQQRCDRERTGQRKTCRFGNRGKLSIGCPKIILPNRVVGGIHRAVTVTIGR